MTMTTWTPYEACAAVEGFGDQDHDEEAIISAWQYLIDLGLVWSLQGWYGRTAARLIAGGICTPATEKEVAP
jgi:hypothetical protein